MRFPLLSLLLLAAAAPEPASAGKSSHGHAPLVKGNPAYQFGSAKFPLVSESEALAKLWAHARQDPASFHFLPAVPVPADLAGKVGKANTSSYSSLQPPVKSRGANARATCTAPAVHLEWRYLTDRQRQAFTAAIACLQVKPARSGLAGATTRWDDLAAIHQNLRPQIHGTGQFLVWHRYFMWMFEQELRNTCAYTGPMVWWDETKDAGRFSTAPHYTADYFGLLPVGNTSCVTTGRFANLTLHIGPGSNNTPHCLARGCNEAASAQVTSRYVQTCQSYPKFAQMASCLEGGPHALGHNAHGGTMLDVSSSVGDAAFFMHHSFVDHVWRLWQVANQASRAMQIGGPLVAGCTTNCAQTTLDYTLTSYGFYPAHPARDFMSTTAGALCYRYNY